MYLEMGSAVLYSEFWRSDVFGDGISGVIQ